MSCALRYIPADSNQGMNMGKGDKRTKKGKIYRGSYGKRRPSKLAKGKKTATPAKRS